MSVTKVYTAPQYHNATGGPYNFWFESTGLASIEIFEIDSNGARIATPLQSYTVVFHGGAPIWNYGVVTFTRPHPEGTVSVEIGRNTSINQLIDFKATGKLEPNIVELLFDKATMICQEIAARKCVKVV